MDPEAPTRYDAFISYSRRDEIFTSKLERALEEYNPPKDLNTAPKRHIKVFRDKNDFTAGDYHKLLYDELNSSSKMILVCSPSARQSEFVNEEIREFVRLKGADNIIPVLYDGIANNEDLSNSDKWAFPQALLDHIEMPLAIDYRGFDYRKDRIKHSNALWYSILACIYGLSREEIEQRDTRRKRRNRRYRDSGITVAFIVLSAFLAFALDGQRKALIGQVSASRSSAEANFLSHDQLEALIDSIRSANALKKIWQPNKYLASSVTQTLRKLAYGVKEVYRWDKEAPCMQTFFASNSLDLQQVSVAAQKSKLPKLSQHCRPDVVVSPDGYRFAIMSNEGLVSVMDVNGSKLSEFKAHSGKDMLGNGSLAFNSDGDMIASSDGRQSIGLWDLQGTSLLKDKTSLEIKSNVILGIGFTLKNDLRIAAMQDDGSARSFIVRPASPAVV